MAECRKCGYVLSPFEKECPRCAQERAMGPYAPVGPPHLPEVGDRAKSTSLWTWVGMVFLIAAVFVIFRLGQKTGVESGAFPPPDQQAPEEKAVKSPKVDPEVLAQCPFDLRVGEEIRTKEGISLATRVPGQPQGLVAQKTNVGRGIECISRHLGVAPRIGDLQSLRKIEVETLDAVWRVQGIGTRSLRTEALTIEASWLAESGEREIPQGRIDIWQEQPFEILKNGKLIGRFNNTDEYWQAQELQ